MAAVMCAQQVHVNRNKPSIGTTSWRPDLQLRSKNRGSKQRTPEESCWRDGAPTLKHCTTTWKMNLGAWRKHALHCGLIFDCWQRKWKRSLFTLERKEQKNAAKLSWFHGKFELVCWKQMDFFLTLEISVKSKWSSSTVIMWKWWQNKITSFTEKSIFFPSNQRFY